ncbi:serine hydrolase domain-containing protein [Sporolactobacillus kofuensis]|uniref:Serine hydrolase domain-containing protein n=1 Tax=Sporolactobacillus kofuensis TaxID=269672 RepID=A0ABW1WG17_9BACL|nr:serine hydrolase domain-containing protein [Sporolactobacillus kofuensis]MCO7175434.1 beta-lactamase family protein [Sporolactobacillus kofuensis]
MKTKNILSILICSLLLGGGILAALMTFKQNKNLISAHHAVQPLITKSASKKLLTVDVSQSKIFKERLVIDRLIHQSGFSGSALIISHGKVILSKGYYLSNLRSKKYNQPLTAYYIGSITKSVTAIAYMQMQERGWIHLNDTVSKFYPYFPNGNRISMLDLLCHMSGLRDVPETTQPMTRDEVVQTIERHSERLASRPGTVWHYSDTNYALLAAILDRVVQKNDHESLHDYIRQFIFQRAGMLHSGFGDEMLHYAYPSTGYVFQDEHAFVERIPSFTQLIGCGDVYATSWDLYLFDRTIAHATIISRTSRQQILSRHFPGVSYSCGWYINRKGWGANTYSSHGVLGGWNGSNAFTKDKQNYIILLSNVNTPRVQFSKLNRTIFHILRSNSHH